MNSTTQIRSASFQSRISVSTLAWILGVALGTVALLTVGGSFLIDANNLTIILVSLLFCSALAFAAGYSRDAAQRPRWIMLIIWWALLCSQEVFNYRTDLTSVSGEDFAPQAFDEIILWIIVFCGVLLTVVRFPHYLRGIFQGDYKWMVALTVYSILSCAYAPNPAFSLAWAFKLSLTVLIVHLCSREMTGLEGICSFLNAILWALVLLIALPAVRSFLEPDPLAGSTPGLLEQRFLHEAPTEISALAGLLPILCLTLYLPKKPKYLLWIATVSFAFMIVAGGKTGIIAGLMSGILFYAMQKRFKAAMGFTAVTTFGITLAILFTPLAEYASNYIKLGAFSSFTGRTDIWSFALPLILQKPVFGHGFYASRFTAILYPGEPFSVIHMHNSFIETLYNNGLVGLGLLMMVLFVIVRNLWRILRHSSSPQLRYVAIGCVAVFVNLFINGMFNATFGGRPFVPYMIMIGLVVVSSHLWQISQRESVSQPSLSPLL